ncbi:MAG TPA: hypothetical protein VLJ58_08885, partial [Ramlibacter sp.]|nr:hypothetical protein [Ramlibacter sp.]
AAALAVVIVLGSAWAMNALPAGGSAAALVAGTCGCIALLRTGAKVRWLAWVGACSFPIYLFHPIFTAASRIAWRRAGVDEVAVLFALGMLAGILMPIFAAWLLRKFKAGYWVIGEKPPKARREKVENSLDAGSSPA